MFCRAIDGALPLILAGIVLSWIRTLGENQIICELHNIEKLLYACGNDLSTVKILQMFTETIFAIAILLT